MAYKGRHYAIGVRNFESNYYYFMHKLTKLFRGLNTACFAPASGCVKRAALGQGAGKILAVACGEFTPQALWTQSKSADKAP